jgi:hypothetical protein
MSDKQLNLHEERALDEGDERMAAELAPFIIDGKFSLAAYRAVHGEGTTFTSMDELEADVEQQP